MRTAVCMRTIWALLLASLTFAARCDRPPSDASNSAPAATPSQLPWVIQPTPTEDSKARMDRANLALHDGDYEAAIALFQQVLNAVDGTASRQALLPLARAYFAAGRYGELVALCEPASLPTLTASDRTLALGLLARSHEALGQWKEAISAYERHLELDDAAAPQLRPRIAKAYRSLHQPQEAVQQLLAVDLAALGASDRADVLEELADLWTDLGDQEGALAAYDQILSFATVAYYRSSILQRKGQLLIEMDRRDQGVTVLRQVLQEYPQTWGAYAALQALDKLDATAITLLQRGQVLYYAGQHERSIDVLASYRRLNPFGFHSTAHLYAGLAYQAMGEYEQAIEQFDLVIDDFAWTDVAGEAWMAKARSLAALGRDSSAVYGEFVRRYPAHARAPEALWRAATALERQGNWEEAGESYAVLHRQYPQYSRADEAAFREALSAYAVEDYGRAQHLWERRLLVITYTTVLDAGASADERARLLTWMGLASARQGQRDSARQYWREAAGLAPHSYYSLRARDLLAGDPLRSVPGKASPVPQSRLGQEDWQRIDAWIQSWSQTEGLPRGAINGQGLVRRADILWSLGLFDEAMDAYRQFRDEITDRPLMLLALARHCQQNDVLAMVISCATRLISDGRSAGAAGPPGALWELAYPSAYGHLIGAEAGLRGMDPLLFLALVRQESQFHPYVTSWAGAIGLAQVMPQTGAWIAQRLGVQPFADDLLLRPVVSVRFGAWYLGQALDLFGQSWPAAVAAYNAGWASVSQWLQGHSLQDHDLFYETIPLTETKAFVRLVYENYRAYQRIHQP